MLKRLVSGGLIGLVVGGLVAFAVVRLLGSSFVQIGTLLAYVFAAVTGLLTGLVAGKPIWSATGKIEAGLKAFFGAVVSLALMFALRTWGNVHVDLSVLHAGQGLLRDLPAVALPMIAVLLAAFFGADNTPEPERADSKLRVANTDAEVAEDEAAAESAASRKMGR